MNDGDWICSDPNCGNINFARRVSCYRCNKERPDGSKSIKKKLGTEIGKTAAEKSRGLFNADDWQCNKCANVNWARRQTCNVCNAPKYGEVEARTGYGGGYNERGVVEYRRREPSSDDEYDEFGRKKRKRKAESQEKVGITEGAEFKKLPPTVLQKDSNMELVMPAFEPKIFKSRPQEKTNGSLSEGSVCDITPLSKTVLDRYKQIEQETQNQQNLRIHNKFNDTQSRKRFVSTGDKDQTASSGYETSSKKSKRGSTVSPIIKSYNPVMENMVSSTNNDVVYKFSGPTPAENFQVTYTIEERVKAAAFAIVYRNCKISTEKFESLFDKPAPDFKTIFLWRQRLLSTGCLLDSHLDVKKDINNKPSISTKVQCNEEKQTKTLFVLPNPDEILISSTDEDDNENMMSKPLRRSVSTETLLIPTNKDNQVPGSRIDDRRSQEDSNSHSTQRRTHSSSRDSQDSNYPDTDSENIATKSAASKTTSVSKSLNVSAKLSLHDSDSDSVSYNSEEDNFLSRVFPNREGRKKRKVKRRPTPVAPPKITNYVPNEMKPFEGYSTVKPTMEQSPLVTGNIYTMNLRNMNVKIRDKIPVDIDTCSSEYVPTRLGSTAKQNYQEFRDNVRRKGFWAKGDGTTIVKNRHSISTNVVQSKPTPIKPGRNSMGDNYSTLMKSSKDPVIPNYCTNVQGNEIQYKLDNQTTDFTKNKSPEETNRVFELVQSNSVVTNRSIMDIFDQNHKSPEVEKEPEKYSSTHKTYEPVWDEDDDALYENTDCSESLNKNTDLNDKSMNCSETVSSRLSLSSPRTGSPISNILYDSEVQTQMQVTPNKSTEEMLKSKQDMLLDLLKDFKSPDITEVLSPLKHTTPQNLDIPLPPPLEDTQKNYNDQTNILTKLCSKPEPIPMELSDELLHMSEDLTQNSEEQKPTKTISSSKKVHIIESVTIPAGSCYNYEPKNKEKQLQSESPLEGIPNNTKTVPVVQNNKSEPEAPTQPPPLELSNLLASINTNNLLLALQTLQQLTHNSPGDSSHLNKQCVEDNNSTKDIQNVETINLTNDEEWERESNGDGSIERQLQRMDGNTDDTPFLADCFDPGPVLIPPNVARKLNLEINNPDKELESENIDENAPVIGNFKSFALPKPVLLNRLKVTVKTTDKSSKKSAAWKKVKRKKKTKSGSSHEAAEGEEDEDEESEDEGDLSKYDLWGSDAEQGNSSKTENVEKEKPKDGENSKESELKSPVDKNEKRDSSASPGTKSSKRRSRSSSSSSSSSSTSSSSHSSTQTPQNKFDDFNLNSERESSPKGRKSRSRSRSPRPRSAGRRKSRDSRSAGETRNHDGNRDKEWSRDRERRDRSRGNRDERKERRYSRDGNNHFGSHGRHR